MRMKANYPAPEIRVAGADFAPITDRYNTLTENGIHAVLAGSDEIVGIPSSNVAQGVVFTESGSVWHLRGGEFETAPDARLLMVNCRPRPQVQFHPSGRGRLAPA